MSGLEFGRGFRSLLEEPCRSLPLTFGAQGYRGTLGRSPQRRTGRLSTRYGMVTVPIAMHAHTHTNRNPDDLNPPQWPQLAPPPPPGRRQVVGRLGGVGGWDHWDWGWFGFELMRSRAGAASPSMGRTCVRTPPMAMLRACLYLVVGPHEREPAPSLRASDATTLATVPDDPTRLPPLSHLRASYPLFAVRIHQVPSACYQAAPQAGGRPPDAGAHHHRLCCVEAR